ncbi:hypothetical protein [Melissospora conviva]
MTPPPHTERPPAGWNQGGWNAGEAAGWSVASPRHGDLPAPPGVPNSTPHGAPVTAHNGHHARNGVTPAEPETVRPPMQWQDPEPAPPARPSGEGPPAERLMVPAQRPAPAGDQSGPGTEPPRAAPEDESARRTGEAGPPPAVRPPNRWRDGLRADSGPSAGEQPGDRGPAEPGAAPPEQSRAEPGEPPRWAAPPAQRPQPGIAAQPGGFDASRPPQSYAPGYPAPADPGVAAAPPSPAGHAAGAEHGPVDPPEVSGEPTHAGHSGQWGPSWSGGAEEPAWRGEGRRQRHEDDRPQWHEDAQSQAYEDAQSQGYENDQSQWSDNDQSQWRENDQQQWHDNDQSQWPEDGQPRWQENDLPRWVAQSQPEQDEQVSQQWRDEEQPQWRPEPHAPEPHAPQRHASEQPAPAMEPEPLRESATVRESAPVRRESEPAVEPVSAVPAPEQARPPYSGRRSAQEATAEVTPPEQPPAGKARNGPAWASLPQRVPAEPDVPTVPEPAAVESPAETPELARIATHLRREGEAAQVGGDQDGFDVQEILAAVREVPGVRDAELRTTPAGAHSLRLDLADGADPADISRQVARLLQDRMGLTGAPQHLNAPQHLAASQHAAGGPAVPAPRSGPPAITQPISAVPAGAPGPEPAGVEESPHRRGLHRGRAVVDGPSRMDAATELHTEQGASGGRTSYSGTQATAAETAPSRPLNSEGPPGPRVVIDHVQISTFGLDATVEVRLLAGGEKAVGVTTGPAVDGYVLRLCAGAAAAAIDELLRTRERTAGRGRCFVEHAAVVPFGNCEVATAIVLLVCDGWVEQLAGSALVAGDPRQAIVRATMAAVNRRLEALLA